MAVASAYTRSGKELETAQGAGKRSSEVVAVILRVGITVPATRRFVVPCAAPPGLLVHTSLWISEDESDENKYFVRLRLRMYIVYTRCRCSLIGCHSI